MVHLLEGLVRRDAGIIDQDIQVTKRFVDLLGHPIGVRKVAHVSPGQDGLTAHLRDLLG
jgi:hypothetical protein